MNLRQIREEYFQVIGERIPTTGLVTAGTSTTQANINSANREINGVIQRLVSEADWSFLRTEGRIRFFASVSTGTISGSAGGLTITGSGTAFTREMEGQLMVFGSNNDFQHRIRSVASTTSLDIEVPLAAAVAAGTGFTVHFDTYKFPRDFKSLVHGRQQDTPAELRYANTQREVQHFLLFDDINGIEDRIDLDFKPTKADYHTTGTVTVTNDSATVEGASSPAWDTNLIVPGMLFRLQSDDDWYIIQSVTDADTLVLDRVYEGTTSAGESYVIDPRGLRQFRVLDYPNTDQYGIFEYHRKAVKLVGDNQVPDIIPEEFHENVIVNRAVYESLKKRRLPAEDVLRDYNEALFMMKKAHLPSVMRNGARIRRVGEGRIRDVGPIITSQNPTGF